MSEALPLLPINQENLHYLLAAMLVYYQYRLRKTPPTNERRHTLLVLALLLPKLQCGTEPHEGNMPLLLTIDEVQVMKGGLAMLLDRLNLKPATRKVVQEIDRLRKLKTSLEQTFSTTQD